ncbi:MAG: DUF4832 domain-containing protein [Clostridiales bacterium]|nr:DUF4832 domain-containing protein [Clostridiales bacterium]
MKKSKKIIISIISLFVVSVITVSSILLYPSYQTLGDEYYQTSLDELEGAIRNPLMGHLAPLGTDWSPVPDTIEEFSKFLKDRPYGTLFRQYFNWIELEYDVSSDFDYFLSHAETKLKNLEKYNIKAIPRVILNWPGKEDEYNGIYWPVDMNDYDYDSTQFRERLELMVQKMGRAWDNDPRIAYIQMGIFGQWGEQHTPSPSSDMQQYAADLFNEHFKNKLIMVRYPTSDFFQNNNYGLYWDEWGSDTQWSVWDRIDMVVSPEYKDRWKTAVFGGENTFNQAFDPGLNGGRFKTFGYNTTFTAEQAFTEKIPEIMKYLGLTHTNHVEMVMTPSYTSLRDSAKIGFDVVQSFMGYRMVIGDVKYTKNVTNNALNVELDITNKGCSPFYYDWNIALSLLDTKTKQPVYTQVFDNISTMDIMPGEDWDIQQAKFTVPPQTHTLSQTFNIPESIKKGKYILAVTMLDPAGMVPAARFANNTQVKGGYTALGYVGVNKKIWFPEYNHFLNFSEKNDYANDISIRYYKNLAMFETFDIVTESGISSAYIEFDKPYKVMSAETVWNNMPDYELWVSADGENWQKGGNLITAKNNTGRNIISKSNVKYVKLSFEENSTAILKTFNIYGE